MYKLFSFLYLSSLLSCNILGDNNYHIEATNLTEEQYPDNPDIGYSSENYQNKFLKEIYIRENTNDSYDFSFITNTKDSVSFKKLSLKEFIPQVPEKLINDEYLAFLSIINQEWNRNQVSFFPQNFKSSNSAIIRVDIARNCLNSYLWEVILYTNENGKELPYSHSWFNFPKKLYQNLFKKYNGLDFEKYGGHLEEWKDINSEKINLSLLRTIQEPSLKIKFENLSNEMYPLKGERERKFKEIVYPIKFETMLDLQSDSTTFATFTPPGFYNRADPRKTELGRFRTLKNIELKKIANQDLFEISLEYLDSKKRTTMLVLGGLNFKDIPTLDVSDCNNGWKTSMGFGNHTFYEKYNDHLACPTSKSSYYGFLADEDMHWLDSHKIGIDGPLMHFDINGHLHLWLLSFERHALVGHYKIKLQNKKS